MTKPKELVFDYQRECLDQKVHDVLMLLSYAHSSYDLELLTLVVRVSKHALAGIKNDLESSIDPVCSRFARVMKELADIKRRREEEKSLI